MKMQLLIGAANSGAGKTTLTTGLLRVLRDRGLKVQSFKCGPDYIDTKYHAVAASCEPVNLDTWMADPDHVRDVYRHYYAYADCCVTEGVMGLFDGYSKMRGSSAEIAGVLNIPVVLVVNAVSTAYSVAPVIYGFMHFRPEVKIAGVIFNKVSSESHYSFLKEACSDIGIRCFGYMPNDKGIVIPSRHLGLATDSDAEVENYISRIAKLVDSHVDVDGLLHHLSINDIENDYIDVKDTCSQPKGITVAVAHDEAFNFTYRENIDNIRRTADIVYFSPLHDSQLPKADILYFPGGYPELYAKELHDAEQMRRQIHEFAANGGKIFAECGGLMYMCRTMNCDGDTYDMTGVLPLDSTMDGARLTLGYRYMMYNGISFRGHEFHYSHLINPEALPSVTQLYNARDMMVPVRLYRKGQVIAGYTHWYWGDKNFTDFWKH